MTEMARRPADGRRACLRIGALAHVSGFTAKTLRFYDEVGLLRPAARTPSGYRLYRDDAVERLRFVRKAQGVGLSLEDIRTILEFGDEGRVPCEHVVAIVDRELARIDSRLRGLLSLRAELIGLRARVSQGLQSGKATPGEGCPHFQDTVSSSPTAP